LEVILVFDLSTNLVKRDVDTNISECLRFKITLRGAQKIVKNLKQNCNKTLGCS
jgi:hypothetical protein